jgi:hypothetical protein
VSRVETHRPRRDVDSVVTKRQQQQRPLPCHRKPRNNDRHPPPLWTLFRRSCCLHPPQLCAVKVGTSDTTLPRPLLHHHHPLTKSQSQHGYRLHPRLLLAEKVDPPVVTPPALPPLHQCSKWSRATAIATTLVIAAPHTARRRYQWRRHQRQDPVLRVGHDLRAQRRRRRPPPPPLPTRRWRRLHCAVVAVAPARVDPPVNHPVLQRWSPRLPHGHRRENAPRVGLDLHLLRRPPPPRPRNGLEDDHRRAVTM